jgi:glycerate-2-kinase
VLAVGKAAPAMLRGLKRRIAREGGRIAETWVVSPEAQPRGARAARLRWLRAGHPLPTAASVRAARAISRRLRVSSPGDCWIVLLSGGTSSLLGAPRAGLTLSDLSRTGTALLRSGASIEEINTVRKHLSRMGGGGILEHLSMAPGAGKLEILTLALSDVPSDRLEMIGSGPSVKDASTFNDCLRVIRKYRLTRKLPPRALDYLRAGARGLHSETLKKAPPGLSVRARIVGSAKISLKAAASLARSQGYAVRELGVLTGDTTAAARAQVRLAWKSAQSSQRKKFHACFLSGGELSVTVRGNGRGGRNQEFVLAALRELARAKAAAPKRVLESRFLIFSAGTDGSDGDTPAAGAWADERTLDRARSLGLDAKRFLKRNDSYAFFKKVGGLVQTGATGTNVMDFRAILLASR